MDLLRKGQKKEKSSFSTEGGLWVDGDSWCPACHREALPLKRPLFWELPHLSSFLKEKENLPVLTAVCSVASS